MVKIKLIILFILCYSGLVFGQKESYNDTLVDLNTINLRMDNYDFQFMCLEDALKNDPLQVYELYITPKCCDYELSSEEITKAICSFSNLRILIIRDLDIHSFPKEIGNLKELQALHLWGISLDSLPNEISELTNLREIYITENENFKKLPLNIGKLYNLEYLTVPDVMELPVSISKLYNLEHLIVPNVMELPVSVCNLQKLELIRFNKNLNTLQEPLIYCIEEMTSLKYILIGSGSFVKYKYIEKNNGDLIKIVLRE